MHHVRAFAKHYSHCVHDVRDASDLDSSSLDHLLKPLDNYDGLSLSDMPLPEAYAPTTVRSRIGDFAQDKACTWRGCELLVLSCVVSHG